VIDLVKKEHKDRKEGIAAKKAQKVQKNTKD
jgi:hypothetical protein